METVRFSKQETLVIQQMLKDAGHDIVVDGIWGPQTAKAYEGYLASSPPNPVIVTPSEAKPWWQSKAQLGTLITLATAVAAIAGYSIDPTLATELVFAVVTLISGGVTLWGNIKRNAPIDSDLIAPGVRISNLRKHKAEDPRGAFSDS
jgi:hypothetical protein